MRKGFAETCQQIFVSLWKDPNELKQKDDQLDTRFEGLESLYRKKFDSSIEAERKWKSSIQKQLHQLDEAI